MPLYDTKKIIEDIDSKELVSYAGIPVKKMGRNYSVLCPFHNDTHY